jgi:oligopeptide/dipeptide ABC transporter ATP-binding protein
VHALDGIDLDLQRGRTLGVAGESGSGKSTLGRALLGLVPIQSGSVELDGAVVASPGRNPTRAERQQMQIVFQDPYDSLDPRHTVERIISEPLRLYSSQSHREYRQQVRDLLQLVNLDPMLAQRLPDELSGGQRQRVGIARTLAVGSSFIVFDEPTSSLDVSVQAQIVNLIRRLQKEKGLTYLFISHNLAVLRHLADSVAILYLGRIVEMGAARDVFSSPQHPYTAALLSAVPVPDPRIERDRERIRLSGEPPSPINLPPGCRFQPRCWRAQERCSLEDPVLSSAAAGSDHQVACFFPLPDAQRER